MAGKKNSSSFSATQDHPSAAAIRKSGAGKVKVACSDIDGILRGKYLHRGPRGLFACRTALIRGAGRCAPQICGANQRKPMSKGFTAVVPQQPGLAVAWHKCCISCCSI